MSFPLTYPRRYSASTFGISILFELCDYLLLWLQGACRKDNKHIQTHRLSGAVASAMALASWLRTTLLISADSERRTRLPPAIRRNPARCLPQPDASACYSCQRWLLLHLLLLLCYRGACLGILVSHSLVNFFGYVFCTRYALPHLRREGGRIVVIGSLAGSL